jgi:hypothetical protein
MAQTKPPILEPFQLFTPGECDEIIARAKSQLQLARTTAGYDKNVRSNTVAWLEWEDQGRFYDAMTSRTDHTVTWLQHPYQVSCYSTGEFYDWHEDLIPSNYRSSIRSLTLTCTLEPAPNAQFQTRERYYDLEKGQAILFPATLEHRATAPKSGTRWALTVWGMKPNPNLREAPSG